MNAQHYSLSGGGRPKAVPLLLMLSPKTVLFLNRKVSSDNRIISQGSVTEKQPYLSTPKTYRLRNCRENKALLSIP